MELAKANHTFSSCKSSQISPDGKLGGKGYVISIRDIRGSFGNIMNSMSELMDTFHDEVNSPYLKKTVLEDNPIIKSILDDAEEIIDKAEDIEDESGKINQNNPATLSTAEKEKVKSILENKWKNNVRNSDRILQKYVNTVKYSDKIKCEKYLHLLFVTSPGYIRRYPGSARRDGSRNNHTSSRLSLIP